jgi:hypothetical protein
MFNKLSTAEQSEIQSQLEAQVPAPKIDSATPEKLAFNLPNNPYLNYELILPEGPTEVPSVTSITDEEKKQRDHAQDIAICDLKKKKPGLFPDIPMEKCATLVDKNRYE